MLWYKHTRARSALEAISSAFMSPAVARTWARERGGKQVKTADTCD